MRILIQGLNYAPELVGIGKYTGEMVDFLVQRGHEVIVVTTPPYYPMWKVADGYLAGRYVKSEQENLIVIRCPLWVPKKITGSRRILHLLSYAISAFPVMVRQSLRKPDVVLTIAPAITSALNAIIAGWLSGAKTWLHIQDFELDAAMNLGVVNASGFVARFAKAVERFVLKRFDRVSSISNAMVAKLSEKGVQKTQLAFFPNWINTEKIFPINDSPMRGELGYSSEDVVVLYSGSMGEKQGLEVLVESARQLSHYPALKFLLCGEGSAKERLQQAAAGMGNIQFLPEQPYEKLNELLNCADIQVLPQRKGASDLMMPSKLLGMMSSGKAIIAGCVPGSELFQVVSQIGLGVVPEDAGALASAILKFSDNPVLRKAAGMKARNFVCTQYGEKQVLQAFEKQLLELSGIT